MATALPVDDDQAPRFAVAGVQYVIDGADQVPVAAGPFSHAEQVLVGSLRVVAAARKVRRVVVTVEPDPAGGPYAVLIEECPETVRVRGKRRGCR